MPAAQFRRDARVSVAVEAVPDRGAGVGLRRAVDVSAQEERPAAPVERAERKRPRGRNILVAVHPPSDAALVLEKMIDGVECPACAAADKDDVAPKGLHAPFLVRKGIRGQPFRTRKSGVADMEDRRAPADGHPAVFGAAFEIMVQLRDGGFLPRLRFVRAAHLELAGAAGQQRGHSGEQCERCNPQSRHLSIPSAEDDRHPPRNVPAADDDDAAAAVAASRFPSTRSPASSSSAPPCRWRGRSHGCPN